MPPATTLRYATQHHIKRAPQAPRLPRVPPRPNWAPRLPRVPPRPYWTPKAEIRQSTRGAQAFKVSSTQLELNLLSMIVLALEFN